MHHTNIKIQILMILKFFKYATVLLQISIARVAQSVEHWSNKPTVAGSIPVVSNQENLTKFNFSWAYGVIGYHFGL